LLRGLYEHSTRLGLRAFFKTILWSINPVRFWRLVQMHHRIRPRRLYLFLFVLLATPWFTAAVIRTASTYLVDHNARGSAGSSITAWDYANGWMFPFFSYVSPRFGLAGGPGWFWQFWRAPWMTGAAVSIAFPFLLLIVAKTRRQHKLHPKHVVRAGVYGTMWLFPFFWFVVVQSAVSLGLIVELLINGRSPGNTWVDVLGLWDAVRFVNNHDKTWCVVLLFWQLLWWWSFMKFYAKFDNPTHSFAILAIPAVLVAILAFTISDVYGVGPSIW